MRRRRIFLNLGGAPSQKCNSKSVTSVGSWGMIFLGLEYATDAPELSDEEIDRQFAELEGKLLKELQSSPRQIAAC